MTHDRIFENRLLRDRTGVFADRREAGLMLADLVAGQALPAPLVMAIPAGGVPVAVPLAERLACPLDVATVSKITLPWNTEAGYGAVAFDGSYQLNAALVASAGLSEQEVEKGLAATRAKVVRRVESLRGKQPLPDLTAHEVVLVDDGLASGFTMLVAVAALRRLGAGAVMVAVPTGHAEAVRRLAAEADRVCCANIRSGRPFAVASAYRQWHDVSETEAAALLKGFRHSPPA